MCKYCDSVDLFNGGVSMRVKDIAYCSMTTAIFAESLKVAVVNTKLLGESVPDRNCSKRCQLLARCTHLVEILSSCCKRSARSGITCCECSPSSSSRQY